MPAGDVAFHPVADPAEGPEDPGGPELHAASRDPEKRTSRRTPERIIWLLPAASAATDEACRISVPRSFLP